MKAASEVSAVEQGAAASPRWWRPMRETAPLGHRDGGGSAAPIQGLAPREWSKTRHDGPEH